MKIVNVGRQVEEQEEEGEHNYLQMMMRTMAIKGTKETTMITLTMTMTMAWR